MSLYAIKDEDGELRDTAWDSPNITREFYAYTGVSVDDAKAEAAKCRDNHVVELVEKAEPLEVSKKAGRELTQLNCEIMLGTTGQSAWLWFADLKAEGLSVADIFRALDVGWTVKQPKRWYVKAPDNWLGNETQGWLYKSTIGFIHTISEDNRDRSADEQFTAEEIDKYHLGGFETVEVTDHEQ